MPWVYVHCFMHKYRSAIRCAKSSVAVLKASKLNCKGGEYAMGICALFFIYIYIYIYIYI